jgi:hypothetical protein
MVSHVPTLLVATGKGATLGVLFKNAEAIRVDAQSRYARCG